MTNRTLPILALVTLAGTAGLTPAVLAQSYTFTKIADSAADNLETFSMMAPTINASGAVAFRAAAGGGTQVILTGSGEGLTLIASNAATYSSFGDFPDINAGGQVVFAAAMIDGSQGIYRWTNGTTETIATTSGGDLAFVSFYATINDAGVAVFTAQRPASLTSMFVGNGTTLTELPEATGHLEYLLAGPDINNNGQIAYLGIDSAGGGSYALVRREPNGAGVVIADVLDGYFLLVDSAMNDSGRIASFALTNTGEARIVVGDENGLTEIAPSPDAYSFWQASIDNAGRVTYVENLFNLTDRLYWNGRVILKSGDTLDGAAILNLKTYRGCSNDAGQVAFRASLDDGRAVIFRADPCLADFNGDGFLTGDDFDQYVAAFELGEPAADFNGDGFVSGDDFDAFVVAFTSGC